jgi:SAM-dependent methyltransferase
VIRPHDEADASLDERARRGHAVLDLPSRDFKAIKICRLIGAIADQPPRRMLEIGTGSGGIAHYFGTAGAMGWDVDSIDVEDVRLVEDGFRFTQVDGVELPFPDASFDVVVSNHVIEHVGDARHQARHLAELARVLRPEGIGYLAVPCRWMLIEPHYRLPFLSWLPQRIADAYVRFAGKGDYYDCRPLTTRELESRLDEAGFAFVQRHGEALRLTYELERPNAPLYRWLLKPVPDVVYATMRRAFPTLIYTLRRTQVGRGSRVVPMR